MSKRWNIRGRRPLDGYIAAMSTPERDNVRNSHTRSPAKRNKSPIVDDDELADEYNDESFSSEINNTSISSLNTTKSSNVSRLLQSTPSTSTRNTSRTTPPTRNVSRTTPSARNTSEVSKYSPRASAKAANADSFNFYYLLIVIVPVLGFLFYHLSSNSSSDVLDASRVNIEDRLVFNIKEIHKHFASLDKYIWSAFYVGIINVLKENQPSVFLLIHLKQDKQIASNLADLIGIVSSRTIHDNSTKPIIVDSTSLNSFAHDHGKIISKYREQLEQCGSMVVHDLHLIHGVVARAFHTFCDRISPLVNQAFIVFTMEVDSLDGKVVSVAEDKLKKIWEKDLKSDLLWPLITRLTGNVLKISPAVKE